MILFGKIDLTGIPWKSPCPICAPVRRFIPPLKAIGRQHEPCSGCGDYIPTVGRVLTSALLPNT